jgi:ubiquinol-cytochrome c reductase iron-sulfur subunit
LVLNEVAKVSEVSHNSVTTGEDPSRRDFIYIAAGAGAAGAAGMALIPLIGQMNPAADTLALASIEYDLSKVTEGMQAVVKWRGKPLFVRHRTPAEIKAAQSADIKGMRDPQTDEERVKKGHEQYLVVIGVCTHLGCVPNFGGGEFNGWFCPCHGSDYDTSGRIRGGPAPKNLEVPLYEFLSDAKIKVG